MSETSHAEEHEPKLENEHRVDDEVMAPPVRAARAVGNSVAGWRLPQRVAVVAVVFGLVGGAVGSYGFIRFFASSIPVSKQQLVVQESSAVIGVAKAVSPAVVSITSQAVTQGFFGTQQQVEGAGTGMIVGSDGLILTNRHVVDDDTANYTVVLSNGKTYPAKVVSKDSVNDLAFVRISASGLPTVKLGDSSAVQVGQQVVAIGNALGQYQNTVTQGIISGLSRGVTAGDDGPSSGGAQGGDTSQEQLSDLFQTDAAINPGNSGGPLVNLEGQVIGIDTAVAGQGSQNIGFAIPINAAKVLVAGVESTGKIQQAYLGVRYVQLDAPTAQANNLSINQGAWVQGDGTNPAVVPGSPADNAGIKSGDIITKVNGTTLNAANTLTTVVSTHKPGQKVTLTVNRGGKTITIGVTLGTAPAAQ